jgi:hypothetical protein
MLAERNHAGAKDITVAVQNQLAIHRPGWFFGAHWNDLPCSFGVFSDSLGKG